MTDPRAVAIESEAAAMERERFALAAQAAMYGEAAVRDDPAYPPPGPIRSEFWVTVRGILDRKTA